MRELESQRALELRQLQSNDSFIRKLQDKEKDLTQKESELIQKKNELDIIENKLSIKLDTIEKQLYDNSVKNIELEEYNKRLQLQEKKQKEEYILQIKDIENRLTEVNRLEKDIKIRNEDLKINEKKISLERESTTSLHLKVEDQSKTLQVLIDTYERKLQGVEDREKALRIKEIRLEDREITARSYN